MMRFIERNARRYAQFPRLAEAPGLIHAFSTRGQDLSARTDAHSARRAERRANMLRDFSLPDDRLAYCVQIHQTGMRIITDPSEAGRLEGTDAVATGLRHLPLMTFSADCPLVLLYDPAVPAVGMVHASWRCTVGLATRKLVDTLVNELGCHPARILAGVGPSAGPESYEVKADVWEAAAALPNRDAVFRERDGRLFFDLWHANQLQLLDAGIPQQQIEIAAVCTMTATDQFYSFRREGPGCGHFALLAALRGD